MTQKVSHIGPKTEWRHISHDIIKGNFSDELTRHIGETSIEEFQKIKDVFGLKVNVPPELGTGVWEIVRLSRNLAVMVISAEYKSDQVLYIQDPGMIKIRIMLSGGMKSQDGKVNLDGVGAFVEAYPGNACSRYLINGKMPAKIVILNCQKEFFTEDLGMDVKSLPVPINSVFDEGAANMSVGGISPIGPDVLRAANDIFRSSGRFSSVVSRAYLQAKSREIASVMVHDLMRQNKNDGPQAKYSVRDVSRVHEARDILQENYHNPPSLPDLARAVGVNQTKLKAVFKATFGMTVRDFVQKCRMDRASELLFSSSLGIAQIAYEVGYDYPANFSNAFKRYFGHSPRQLLRASKEATAE